MIVIVPIVCVILMLCLAAWAFNEGRKLYNAGQFYLALAYSAVFAGNALVAILTIIGIIVYGPNPPGPIGGI